MTRVPITRGRRCDCQTESVSPRSRPARGLGLVITGFARQCRVFIPRVTLGPVLRREVFARPEEIRPRGSPRRRLPDSPWWDLRLAGLGWQAGRDSTRWQRVAPRPHRAHSTPRRRPLKRVRLSQNLGGSLRRWWLPRWQPRRWRLHRWRWESASFSGDRGRGPGPGASLRLGCPGFRPRSSLAGGSASREGLGCYRADSQSGRRPAADKAGGRSNCETSRMTLEKNSEGTACPDRNEPSASQAAPRGEVGGLKEKPGA